MLPPPLSLPQATSHTSCFLGEDLGRKEMGLPPLLSTSLGGAPSACGQMKTQLYTYMYMYMYTYMYWHISTCTPLHSAGIHIHVHCTTQGLSCTSKYMYMCMYKYIHVYMSPPFALPFFGDGSYGGVAQF